ncbi:hypothetical protein J4E82_005324 [Alternaria postmessia]|uniref:uncharacterized protein n=1 Tax=Alternaria postmessia TaxID=1187938 RepID=UPI0022258B68|nr:uncharacterized protein J4E82_005324 [Alternaria postmessia]KAI5375846.1 hypothetical protein J4E82_005324 [Alternaria postmessia]
MQEPKPVRSSSLGICACFTQECDRSVEDDVAGIKFNALESTNLTDLGKPDAKFRCPVNKHRSPKNLEILRNVEAASGASWYAVDGRLRDCTGTTPHDIVCGIIKDREPLWAELDKASECYTPVDFIYVTIPTDLHDPTKQITGKSNRINLSGTKKAGSHDIAALHDNDDQDNDADEQRTTTFRMGSALQSAPRKDVWLAGRGVPAHLKPSCVWQS